MMFPNDLINDLQEAYGTHGPQEVREEGLCGIFVGSSDEMQQRNSHSTVVCEVDFPPLDGAEKNRLYLGMWWSSAYDPKLKRDCEGKPVPHAPGERESSPCEIACRNFLNLADRLGASLPLKIRKSVAGELSMPPCAIWCLLLYREHALHDHARVWREPFRSSLALAERLEKDGFPTVVKLPAKPKGEKPKRVSADDPFKAWELEVVKLCGPGGAQTAWDNNKDQLISIGIESLRNFKPIHERRRKEAFPRSENS